MPSKSIHVPPEGVLRFSRTFLRSASFLVSVFQQIKPEIQDVCVVRNLYRRPSWVEANSRKQEGADKTLQSSHAHLRSARSSSRPAADGQPGTDSVTAQVTAIEECPTVWLNVIFLICGYEISRKSLMEIMRGLCLWMLDLYWKLLNWRYFHSCGYVASKSHRFLALLYRWVITIHVFL